MFLYALEIVVFIIILLFFITQVVIPIFNETQLFPILKEKRSKTKANLEKTQKSK